MGNISRSEYQKVCEENKRLKKDIKVLVSTHVTQEKLICIAKWRHQFRKEEEQDILLRAAAKKHIEQNQDSLPDFLKNKE